MISTHGICMDPEFGLPRKRKPGGIWVLAGRCASGHRGRRFREIQFGTGPDDIPTPRLRRYKSSLSYLGYTEYLSPLVCAVTLRTLALPFLTGLWRSPPRATCSVA